MDRNRARYWLLGAIALGVLATAFFTFERWSLGEPEPYLQITREEATHDEFLQLNESEVQDAVPHLAEALRITAERGRVTISDISQIKSIWAYLDSVSDVKRRTMYVMYDDVPFLLMMRDGEV